MMKNEKLFHFVISCINGPHHAPSSHRPSRCQIRWMMWERTKRSQKTPLLIIAATFSSLVLMGPHLKGGFSFSWTIFLHYVWSWNFQFDEIHQFKLESSRSGSSRVAMTRSRQQIKAEFSNLINLAFAFLLKAKCLLLFPHLTPSQPRSIVN